MFHRRGHASTEVQTPEQRRQLAAGLPPPHQPSTQTHSPRGQQITVHRWMAGCSVTFRPGLILLTLAVAMAFGAIPMGTGSATSQDDDAREPSSGPLGA